MITISDKGAEKVHEFLAGQEAEAGIAGLRVGVRGGGCSGFQYQLAFDEQREGDVVLIGSPHCSGTLRIKEFLTRNGHPYTYLDLDKDTGVQEMLDKFKVGVDEIPVLICRGTMASWEISARVSIDCGT